MIVFGVTATRNQLCPSRSIREAPSSPVLDDGAHDIASELVRGPHAPATRPPRAPRGAARNEAPRDTVRAPGRPPRRPEEAGPERSMDEGAGGGDTAMGMLPMLGFKTRHRSASGGAERSHLPLLDPAVVTKILPWSGPLSRIAVFGRPSRHQNRTKFNDLDFPYQTHTPPILQS